jgi:hypothetical protein
VSRTPQTERIPHFDELTARVIREAINDDVSEATEGTPKAIAAVNGGDQP